MGIFSRKPSEFERIFDEAIDLVQMSKENEAIILLNKFGENENAAKVLAICNYNIGQRYDQKMDYNSAYKNYSEAYKFASQLYKKDSNNNEYKEIFGMILYAIGNLFGSLNKHDSAIKYLEKSKSILGNQLDIFKYLGQEYFFNEQIEQSKKYLSVNMQ